MRHRVVYLALSLLILGTVSAAQAQVTAKGQARGSFASLLGDAVGLLNGTNTGGQEVDEPGSFSEQVDEDALGIDGVLEVISGAASTVGTANGINSSVSSTVGETTADVLNGTVEAVATSALAQVTCNGITADAGVNALTVGNQAIDIPLDPQPNTEINVLGVANVILNRQEIIINPATRSVSVRVDAVVIQLLTGDLLEVILSTAFASLENLPASCPVIGGPGGTPVLGQSLKSALLTVDGGSAGFADPGDRIRFTVRAINSGTAAATGVNIIDRLPRFSTIDLASVRLDGAVVNLNPANCPANVNFNGCPGEAASDAARQCLSTSIANLAAGDSVDLTFEVTINQGATGNICNTAFINDQERTAIVPVASVVNPPQTPNLGTSVKNAQIVNDSGNLGFADPGELIRFTITATNSGLGAATGVLVLDRLPLSATFVPNSVLLNGIAVTPTVSNCPNNIGFNGCPGELPIDTARQCLSVNIGNLAPGASTNLTLDVTVNQGATGNICNTAFVGTREVTAIVPVIGAPQGNPNLSTSRKTAQLIVDNGTPALADPGDRIRFTLRAINSGTAAAVAVPLIDRIPLFVTLDQTSVRLNGAQVAFTVNNCPSNVGFSGCGDLPIDTTRQCLSASIPSLAAGASADLTFEATVNANVGRTICNVGVIGDRNVNVSIPGPLQIVTTGGGGNDGGGGCALNPRVASREAWPVFLLALLWMLHRRRRAGARL